MKKCIRLLLVCMYSFVSVAMEKQEASTGTASGIEAFDLLYEQFCVGCLIKKSFFEQVSSPQWKARIKEVKELDSFVPDIVHVDKPILWRAEIILPIGIWTFAKVKFMEGSRWSELLDAVSKSTKVVHVKEWSRTPEDVTYEIIECNGKKIEPIVYGTFAADRDYRKAVWQQLEEKYAREHAQKK